MTKTPFRAPGRPERKLRPDEPSTNKPTTGEPQAGGRVSGERSAGRRSETAPRRDNGGSATIYGFHAVLAALTARRRALRAIHVTAAAADRLAADIAAAGLMPRIVTSEELSRRLGPSTVHQGVLLEAGPLPHLDLEDIVGKSGLVLVLDQITDPHNVGAILRTAAAFAVDALVTTTRHTPDLTGTVAKAASGGLEAMAVVEVVNLARALETLGDLGYLRVGLDSDGAADFAAMPLRRPLALVLGAEDKGLRRLTRENCDAVARLDMPGLIKSLNVSNACAVALTLASLRSHVPQGGAP